ncbi:MAG: replicative DNA helicase, partial [candidate division Zixibacteria bacterium]|nr:replicative DNA helicase [candidate division Zixibacteria bacterium]
LDSGQVLTGVKTGYFKLDEMTLGLHAGDLIIIAGRPSMGKTSLALNIAERVATEQNIGVGVFSLEMSTEQLVFRMLSGRAGLNQQMLRKRPPNDREWPRLTTSANILSAAPIFIDDSASLSPLEMRAKARRLKAQHNIGMIVVDYIQLMRGSGRFENRQNEIAMISQSLKSMAKELAVPLIAISQLSRQVEQRGGDKRPQLADLRESGAIEQDADLVMFVYRKEMYLNQEDKEYQEAQGAAEIIIAKQRNGPIGSIFLTFLKDLARFENRAGEDRSIPPDAMRVTDQDAPF